MNLMRWLLPLLLLPAWGWSAEPLQIGLLRDRLPYSDLDAQRQPQGAASELLNVLSTQSGLHFSAQAASNRDQLAQMLSQQRIQLALPPPQSSPPPTGILLSKPLWQQRWALVVRRDSLPLQHQLMPDLRHQRLLSLRHSPVQAALLTTYPGVALGEAATLHEALRLLNAGAAQGIVCDARRRCWPAICIRADCWCAHCRPSSAPSAYGWPPISTRCSTASIRRSMPCLTAWRNRSTSAGCSTRRSTACCPRLPLPAIG
jgi:hypothetical protein